MGWNFDSNLSAARSPSNSIFPNSQLILAEGRLIHAQTFCDSLGLEEGVEGISWTYIHCLLLLFLVLKSFMQ
ncbi:hypothetical protein Pfo_001389 [Paulownia fortunei]|nr:hypothetical protein Pfo_001389 [Paulownia fortunei]